MSQFKIKKT